MNKEQRERLREQAIESNRLRMNHIQTFLDKLSLDNDVNKTVALELGSAIGFIEKDTKELIDLKGSGDNQKRDIKKCGTCKGDGYKDYDVNKPLIVCTECSGDGYIDGKVIKGYIYKDKSKLSIRDLNNNPLPAFGNNPLTADDIDVLMFELAIIKQKISGDNK